MKKLIGLFVILLLISGCSVKAVNEKSVYSIKKVKVGDTRDTVKQKLGKPHSIDALNNYHYKFCSEQELAGRRATHVLMDIATLGLWEAVGTPAEKLLDCDRVNEVVIVFGEDDRVIGAYSLKDYQIILLSYLQIQKALNKMKANNNYTLIYYADHVGWLFVYKKKIDCAYEGKYIKAYIAAVPSLVFSLNLYSEAGEIAAQAMEVVLFDINKERYLEVNTKYATLDGKVISEERSNQWEEVYPETIQEQLMNVLTFYCVNKILKEYQGAPDKPKVQIKPQARQGAI